MIPHIIGISGKTGAGKSTLAKLLSLNLQATLISWDDFDPVSDEPLDYIDWYNRGAEYSEFQRTKLENVLEKLKSGKSVFHPVLDQEMLPTKYIIFDAPLGRLHKNTGKWIDTCVHIDVPLDVLLCRRVLRDFSDKLKTKEDLLDEINFYLNHSRPLYLDADLKKNATIVLDGLISSESQVQLILNYIKQLKPEDPAIKITR